MKGFKPTGYGMRSGFRYPASMGFTSSTGQLTNVSGYTRRKGFASGGFVRQDNPRMKEESPGDPGHALQRRNQPSNNLDQESGGRTPLRPGFKNGGKNWIKGAIKKPGALHRALGVPEGQNIPAKKMAKAAHSDNPTMRRRAALAKTLKKMNKADGGRVIPRYNNSKSFRESASDVPKLFKELVRSAGSSATGLGSGMASKAAGLVSGRQRYIDRTADEATSGSRVNYRKGGYSKIC